MAYTLMSQLPTEGSQSRSQEAETEEPQRSATYWHGPQAHIQLLSSNNLDYLPRRGATHRTEFPLPAIKAKNEVPHRLAPLNLMETDFQLRCPLPK